MSVRIICDSSVTIPERFLEKLDIVECPASIIFGDEIYRNKIDMSHEEFYRRLQALPSGAPLPTTTQPSPGQFRESLEQVKREGATAAIITVVSERLSGTYSSAVQAAEMERDIPVVVWDTASASLGSGWQTIVAAEMAQAGATQQEILAVLPDVRGRIRTVLTVDTLKYLVAGGRLSPIQGMMGTLLSVKPMLHFEDGLVKPLGRERGRSAAKRALIDYVRQWAGDRPLRLAIANANVPDEAEAFAGVVGQELNVRELMTLEIGPVLAALAGPGVLALAALQVEA